MKTQRQGRETVTSSPSKSDVSREGTWVCLTDTSTEVRCESFLNPHYQTESKGRELQGVQGVWPRSGLDSVDYVRT